MSNPMLPLRENCEAIAVQLSGDTAAATMPFARSDELVSRLSSTVPSGDFRADAVTTDPYTDKSIAAPSTLPSLNGNISVRESPRYSGISPTSAGNDAISPPGSGVESGDDKAGRATTPP